MEEVSHKSIIMPATPTARAPVSLTVPKLGIDEVSSVEKASAVSCVAESEAAVGVVEISMGADLVELLLPPEAVWFESAPPMAVVGMAVISGLTVIVEVLLFDGGELVGFDGLVGCNVLGGFATASTSAFLSLALLDRTLVAFHLSPNRSNLISCSLASFELVWAEMGADKGLLERGV